MMFVFAAFLALASRAAPAQGSAPCDSTSATVSCKGKGLVEIPAMQHKAVVHLDLEDNAIDSLFTVVARRTRHRRDWTSPCAGGATFSGQPYSEEARELEIEGDYDPTTDTASELSAVPASSLCDSVANTLEALVLGGNKITEVPPLGTATGGLNMKALRIFMVGGNLITELAADTFTGVETLVQIDVRNNMIAVLPRGLFKGLIQLQYVSFSGNKIMRMPVSAFADTPYRNSDSHIGTSGADNVLMCSDANRLENCRCNSAHADYPVGATSFVVAGNVECSVFVDLTLDDLGSLKGSATEMDAALDALVAHQATLAGAAAALGDAVDVLASSHAKMTTYGCPEITRRFRYRK